MEDLKLEDEESPPPIFGVGPLLGLLADREMGLLGRGRGRSRPRKVVGKVIADKLQPESEEIAEERLITKDPLGVLPCKLMGNHTRSTFLMVFSPDKELLASTHGDHNIYITEIKTGECIQTLKGHPRTPWCVAFHPSHKDLLASGCLGGHVRIWDLNGGSELWTTDSVIASLAFHPVERLLVIATLNELHFWDWSHRKEDQNSKDPRPSRPFCKVSTKSDKEKVRYVKFDSFGHHLITGIANLNNAMHNYSNIYSTTRGHMSAQHRVLARSRGRYGLQVPPSMNQMMPSTSDSSPTYGRYYRGTVDPIVRPRPQPPTSTNLPTSTASSASQTLSDLAAAASDRLMAENAAAAAAAEAIRAQVAADLRTRSEDIRVAAAAAAEAAHAAAEAAEVLPRFRRLPDDPLLSDHPYGMSNGRPPPPNYGEILLRSADSRALSESIYHRERRIQQLLMRFRHSPESSFVEYAPEVSHGDHHGGVGQHLATEMYVNPDRALASETNNRYREIRERRIQRQLERRQLRRNLQEYHRISASATSASSTRPIDDWAINRRLTLQQNQSGGGGLSLGDPLLRLNSSPTRAASLASNDDNDASSVIAQAGDIYEERSGGPNLRDLRGPVEPEVVSRPTASTLVGSSLEGLRFPNVSSSPGSDLDLHMAGPANLASATSSSRGSGEPPPLPNPRDFLTSSPGSIGVPEFKCPFCDRTYGFECNWRAHIREQHQGWTSRNENIRVSQIAGSTTSGTSLSAAYGSSTTPTISNPDSPGGSASGAPNNDHNYTLSPGTSSTASSAASTPVNNANRSSRDSNTNLNNIDIAQLNNHIDHMQRICRDSLADCTASRRRRQMIRLKSIKRILEDLQKQIRSLRNASKEETPNRNTTIPSTTTTTPSASATSAPLPSTSSGPSTSGLDNPTAGPSTSAGSTSASTSAGTGNRQSPSSAEIQQMARMEADSAEEDDDIEASLGLDERNYDERVGEGNRMRSLAQRSLSMAIKRLSSEQPRRPPQPQESLHRTSNRLSRVHSQLVSQMRATFRAMEKSNQQQQQQQQPLLQIDDSTSEQKSSSKSETTKKQPPSKSRENDKNTKLGLNTKQELRALSQRLERMLREQREASNIEAENETPAGTGNAAAKNNTTTTLAEMEDIDIPRPDPMPLDPRKRWRHMYDGTLPPRPSTASTSTSTSNNSQSALQELLDSSESGSESDFDIRNTGRWRTSSRVLRDLTTPRRLRWRPLDQRRMASSPHRHAQRVFVRRSNGSGSGSMVDPVDVPYIEADEANEDMGTERLPPLRELIWRRLRRRNAHVRFEEEPEIINGLQRPPQATSRTREALSWMVDQMRIDQAANANPVDSGTGSGSGPEQQQQPQPRDPPPHSTRTITSARPIPHPAGGSSSASGNAAPPWLSIGDLYGSDHASFRSRYVNRIRTEDAPNRMHRHNDHYMFSNQSQLLTHRIQAWDFSKGDIPDLTDSEANIVVQEAKIHNDASVDISEDGSLLVTLVPSNLPMTTVVGVYSLSPASKGRLFASFSLESSAVSVSLSPTSKHLMVGLAMRPPRITLSPSDRTLIAQIYRIKMPWENQVNNSSSGGGNGNEEQQQPPRGRLIHRRDLHQNEPGQTSLNCIRWIPVAGQGLVYATNTGLLKILR